MPIAESIPNLAYGFGRGTKPVETERPTGAEVIKASTFYNPVVAGYDYLTRDQFSPQEGFSPKDYGGESDLWNDNFLALGQTTSPQEFEALSDRIRTEKKNEEILQAAGGWGLAASIVSGSLSPTVFIPLVGQAKGLKAVGQTLALAGTAAAADELVLLGARETYTGTDAAIGIAAGTALGGLLGSAARFAKPAEVSTLKADVSRYTELDTGMVALHDKGAIRYTEPRGASTAAERIEFDKPSVMTADARAALPKEELKILEDLESGKIKVQNEDGALRLRYEKEPAASGTPVAQGLEQNNVVSRVLNKALTRLNPVTRTVQQNYSAAAKRFGFQASDAGLRGDQNAAFIPHASEGTLEARIVEYDAFVGQFTQELSDAFARHIEGDRVPEEQLQGEVRARIKSAVLKPEGKFSSEEFNSEVFLAAQKTEPHPDPNVNKAANAWRKFRDQFSAYAEEAHAKRLEQDPSAKKLFDPDGNLGPGAEEYVYHVFSPNGIAANPQGFVDMLTNNAELQSQRSFAKDFERHSKRLAKLDEEAEILNMTPEEGRKAFADTEEEIGELTSTAEYSEYREARLSLDRELREAKAEGAPDEELADIRADLKALKESSPELQEMLAQESALKKRRRALNRTLGKTEDTQAELIAKAEELEVQDLNALDRVMRAGANLQKRLDKLTDKAQLKELDKLWAGVAKSLKSVETQDSRIAKLYGGKALTPEESFAAYQKATLFSKRRAAADAKSEALLKRIDKIESLDLEEQRQLLTDVRSLNNAKVRDVNARRALREERLLEKAEASDPELIAKRADELELEYVRIEEDFQQKWEERGATDINLGDGTANFSSYAKQTGTELAEKIKGLHNPVAGLEILGGARGPELARVLDIPLEIKAEFLEQNMEVLARTYSRKLGPDIELYRATGSVNAASVFEEVAGDFTRLRGKILSSATRPASRADFKAWKAGEFEVTPDTKVVPFAASEKSAVSLELDKAQKDVTTDLRVMVTRLRNQRGLPEDPEGMMYRMGRVAKDMNVARYMGSVLPSSVADVGRPVMRYGISKTFKHGWAPLFKGLTRLKGTRREGRRMGTAWDPTLHNRVQQVMDAMDDYASRKSVPERISGFVANKTGFVAGFDRWTAEMKHIASSVVIGELSEGLYRIFGGGSGDQQWYKSFLAEHGISEEMGARIWKQYNKEGGSELFEDGFRLPNTEDWDDIAAKRAMRAAVNRAVDSTIITPGLDRPNWVDENLAFSMLAQFQSFTFASTNRTLLSGAQQADMALVNGMAISLAMGAVSYYIWAMSIGGDHLARANEFDPGQWTDEAIARSGLLGALSIPLEVGQKLPATQGALTFGDQPTSRRRNQGLVGTALGPSFDLLEKAVGPNALATNLDNPTASNLHQARLLAPWQNVFWLRQAIDAVEASVASSLNLPDRRQ